MRGDAGALRAPADAPTCIPIGATHTHTLVCVHCTAHYEYKRFSSHGSKESKRHPRETRFTAHVRTKLTVASVMNCTLPGFTTTNMHICMGHPSSAHHDS
jgi:hypothetical protein